MMSPPAFFPNVSHVQRTGCFTHFDFDVGRLLQVIPMFLTFSARTSANQTQDIVDAKMEKKRKVS
jgi:hypothetical protein